MSIDKIRIKLIKHIVYVLDPKTKMDTQNNGSEKQPPALNVRPFLDLFAGYCFDTDYVLISCKGCHDKSISNITSKPCRKSYQDHIRKFGRHILLKLSFLDEKSCLQANVKISHYTPEN